MVHVDHSKRLFCYVDASQEHFSVALHQQFLEEASEGDVHFSNLGEAHIMHLDRTALAEQQKKDAVWSPIIRRLQKGEVVRNYALDEDLLVQTLDDLVCLPTESLKMAMRWAHDNSGHAGFTRTYQKIMEQWYHPRMAELCRSWVRRCPDCIRGKLKSKTPGSMIVDEIEGIPFHTIAMDLICGLPRSEKQPLDQCLVVVDVFTKTTLLRPLTTKSGALEVARAIEDSVLRQGWKPSVIISDSDLKFIGTVGRQLAQRIGADLRPSVPYHQQANPAERQIQTLLKTLRVQMLDKPHVTWPDELPALELSLNNTPNGVTGYAPYDLLYIHRPRLIETILEHAGTSAAEERWSFSAAKLKQASD